MAGLNKMLVIGNVGTDPEMKYTPNGNPVTSFSVVTWNKLAESCNQYLSKGKRVYVEGRLKSQTWQGQVGQPQFKNEIIATCSDCGQEQHRVGNGNREDYAARLPFPLSPHFFQVAIAVFVYGIFQHYEC